MGWGSAIVDTWLPRPSHRQEGEAGRDRCGRLSGPGLEVALITSTAFLWLQLPGLATPNCKGGWGWSEL